jgi:hypothetical protein
VIAKRSFGGWFGKNYALIRANSRLLVLLHYKIQFQSGDSNEPFLVPQNHPFFAGRRSGRGPARSLQ